MPQLDPDDQVVDSRAKGPRKKLRRVSKGPQGFVTALNHYKSLSIYGVKRLLKTKTAKKLRKHLHLGALKLQALLSCSASCHVSGLAP